MVARRNVAYEALASAQPLTEEADYRLLTTLQKFEREKTRRLTKRVVKILDEILAGLEDIEERG